MAKGGTTVFRRGWLNVAGVASVIVLRKKRPDLDRPYKTWGYPVTPIIFVLAAVGVAIFSLLGAFWNAIFGLVIICLGIPAYLYWKAKLRKTSAA